MDSKSKKKSPQNLCSLFFENKGVEFINIACILHDPDIIKSLLSSSVKFPMPMVTCKLTPPISTKILNLNKFVINNLDLDLYLTNLDSLYSNLITLFLRIDTANIEWQVIYKLLEIMF